VGGIGTGSLFALEGDQTLGRNESRPAKLLDVRDYCKLHIVTHYISRLGRGRLHVLPIGNVGNDPAGIRLREEMIAAGMDLRFVGNAEGRPTLQSVCFQYPDGSGGNLTTSDSAASTLEPADVDRAMAFLGSLGEPYLALAVPEVPLAIRRYFLEAARRQGVFCAASFTTSEIPGALESGMPALLDLLALNEDEARQLAGFGVTPVHEVLPALERAVTALSPACRIIVTAGAKGAYAFEHGVWGYCPCAEVEVRSTGGAGDALLAGALTALAGGIPLVGRTAARRSMRDRPLSDGLEFGSLVAGFSVTSPHTIHPDASPDAIVEFAAKLGVELNDALAELL
jgi:sugar/nucleoside kinase (ribokinase family)